MKHVVLLSGGISSALVAIEVFRKYGNKDIVLLTHEMNPRVEHITINKFRRDIANHIGVGIVTANYQNKKYGEIPTPLEICKKIKAFKVKNGQELCTSYLKTQVFYDWVHNVLQDEAVFYYGFDKDESSRIERRRKIMQSMGYKTCFPLAEWERTIQSVSEINIAEPSVYSYRKHANCIGCLKAGMQHWYVVYCRKYDIFLDAIEAEKEIGYSIIKGRYLSDLEPMFKRMRALGVDASEHIPQQRFWAIVNRYLLCQPLEIRG